MTEKNDLTISKEPSYLNYFINEQSFGLRNCVVFNFPAGNMQISDLLQLGLKLLWVDNVEDCGIIYFSSGFLLVLTLGGSLSPRQRQKHQPFPTRPVRFVPRSMVSSVELVKLELSQLLQSTQDCQLTLPKTSICLLFLLVGTSPETIWDKCLIVTFSLFFVVTLSPE